MTGRLVAAGSALALAGAAHAAVNARLLRRAPERAGDPPRVSVLVPARDEQANIAACVSCLVDQPGLRELIVLDDGSTDATGARARAAGARVVRGAPVPDGWLGKPWACAQLAAAADPASDILVFVDADVRLEPGGLARAVALLGQARLDIICPFPRQDARGPAERVIQPLLQWSWLTTLPLRLAERSPRPSLTAACGQFVVVRRAALEAAGGHAAVRSRVLDDIALVRAIKASGGRGGVVDGAPLARCRMYEGWPELRDGYAKSLWAAFGSPLGAGAVLAGLGLAYVLPPLAAVRGSGIGLLGYAGAVGSRVIAARVSGSRAVPDAAAHPASIVVLGYLTARSFAGHRRGALRWKGRPVDAPMSGARTA